AYIAVDSQLVPKHVSIEIDRSFIEKYKNRVTVRTVLKVDKAMTEPLPPPLDGDLHIAGRAPQVELPIVAEIANAKDEKAAVEFVMKIASDPQLVVSDGRFVIASVIDRDSKPIVERVRMVFARGTPPERAVKSLKSGQQLHVYGGPRLDFAEIARRVKSERTG